MSDVIDMKEFEKTKVTKEIVDAFQRIAMHETEAELALIKLEMLLPTKEFRAECERRGIDMVMVRESAACARSQYLDARDALLKGGE